MKHCFTWSWSLMGFIFMRHNVHDTQQYKYITFKLKYMYILRAHADFLMTNYYSALLASHLQHTLVPSKFCLFSWLSSALLFYIKVGSTVVTTDEVYTSSLLVTELSGAFPLLLNHWITLLLSFKKLHHSHLLYGTFPNEQDADETSITLLLLTTTQNVITASFVHTDTLMCF